MAKKADKQTIAAVIPPAGMRAEHRRRDNNAGVPGHDSIVEEIQWRKEHQQ